MEMYDIGASLKMLRKAHRLKQKQVAEYLGISQQSYSNYERNAREIPAVHAVKLADMYQVSTDCLFGIPHPLADYGLYTGFTQGGVKNMLPDGMEALIYLQNMDEKNRQAFLRFLSYLCSMQEKEL